MAVNVALRFARLVRRLGKSTGHERDWRNPSCLGLKSLEVKIYPMMEHLTISSISLGITGVGHVTANRQITQSSILMAEILQSASS